MPKPSPKKAVVVRAKRVVSTAPATPEVPPDVRERIRELHLLSQALAETARRHVDRLQREIAEVAEAVPELGRKDLAKLSCLVADLQIKPHKGRRKDLKKIDLLIGELQQLVGK